MKCLTIVSIVLFVAALSSVSGQQGLQSLSYPEGVIVNPRPVPTTSTTTTTTTTIAPETTSKRGFFGGIRNFFGGGKSSTTTPLPPTTPRPTSPRAAPAVTPPTPSPTTARTTPRPPVAQSSIPIVTPTTQSTTTTKRPTTREEFPALPGQKKQSNNNPSPVVTPSLAPAWNRPTTPSTPSRAPTPVPIGPVRFVPKDPQPPSMFTTKATTLAPGTVNLAKEVKDVSETLFTKDTANLVRYVTPNYQRKTVSYSLNDEAPEKFLTVDEARLNSVATVEKMKALFNNYELDTSVNEHSTALEKNEENDFIDEMMKTNVMRTLMQFLQTKDVVTADPKSQKDFLKTIWFTMYSRGQGRIGSSGFEHVFLAENKNGTVIGLHNWIFLYEMEKSGHLDYKGWIKKLDLGPNKGSVAKIRFAYDSMNKPVNGVFLGTTPELEIALYTLCFATFPDNECTVSSNGNDFIIRTYTFRYRGKKVIGSAYPEVK